MSSRDALNPFSRRFAECLFQAHPDWEVLVDLAPWPNHDPGCFAIAVPSPADHDRELLVSTDGDEITIGFGPEWHAHYGKWSGAEEQESFTEALACIQGILTESLVTAVGVSGGMPRVSTLLGREEEPRFGRQKLDQIITASWYGTYDRITPA